MEFNKFIEQFKKELKKTSFSLGKYQNEVNEDDTYLWISDAEGVIGNAAENYHYEIISPEIDDDIESYFITGIQSNRLNHIKGKIYLELHAEFDLGEEEAYSFYIEKILPLFSKKSKHSDYELFSWESEINKPLICIRCNEVFEINNKSIKKILDKLTTFDKEIGKELRIIIKDIINLSELKLEELEIIANKQAQKVPKKIVNSGGQYYRSPAIAEYIKRKANGICQLCNNYGPKDNANRPYLECHHIKWLSIGGADDLQNVVALCPNCHREVHLKGIQNRKEFNKLKKCKRIQSN